MDIYNSRYFKINKTLLSILGLWPYQNYKRKLLLRICVSIIMICMIVPQILRIYLFLGVNIDILIEHVAALVYLLAMYLKVLTSIVSENKLRRVYDNVLQNWELIKNENERNILIQYSERGRLLTIGYIVYMLCALVTFTSLPLTPMILNKIMPLNESRPPVYILGGEFFVDREKNYGKIYFFDYVSCIMTACIICAVDTMYAVCIEHCLGLFAVIKFRLKTSTTFNIKDNHFEKFKTREKTYDYIVRTIQLHTKVIIFTDILESSYSSSFLILMGLNMLILSLETILVLIKLGQILELIRFTFILFGILIHLFYISWPGQKITDFSVGLFEDAYLNEWYESSLKTQKLLGFMTLRCIRPCQLTAGGLYVMNFTNFAAIVKTSMSYMTMFASFR